MNAKDQYTGNERRKSPRLASHDDVERLERIVRDMPQLTAEEHKLLYDVLNAYRGWLVLGKAAKMLVVFLAGVSAVAIAGGHIKAALKSWLL